MIYAEHDQTHPVEPLDLSELMEDMLELLKVSISKHALLKTDLDQNLPAVRGDAPQIRQAVMNLVINASEAIGEKEGVIQVCTSRVTVREDSLLNNAPTLPPGEYVQLEVSDTGCGMTEEARAKIFHPFFTTKFAGRGLGLAVVQGIVRDHRGVVEVVSADGQGATFRVLLPCTSKRDLGTQSASTSSSAEQSNARVGTVLLVEDEEVIRLAISKALGKKWQTFGTGVLVSCRSLVKTYCDVRQRLVLIGNRLQEIRKPCPNRMFLAWSRSLVAESRTPSIGLPLRLQRI